MLDLNTETLFLGLLFSSIGFGYFIYGRKQANTVVKYSGIALIVYPYFIADTLPLLAIGLGLIFLPKFIDFE
jgi:hypothetical protein